MLNDDDDDAATGDGDVIFSRKIERGKLTDYAAYARYVRTSKCREEGEGRGRAAPATDNCAAFKCCPNSRRRDATQRN